MKCMYCGRENPDGAVYCECGRPLKLGGAANTNTSSYTPSPDSPFASQTLADVKRTRSVPVVPIVFILALLIGAGVFFGMRWLEQRNVTKEDTWETVSEPLWEITVPSGLKKGDMLTVQGSSYDLLGFYSSRLAGFDVSVHTYTDPEKEMYGGLNAKDFAEAFKGRTVKINDNEIKYIVREGANYIYGEYPRHCANYIGKSDEVWYIEGLFPYADGFFLVDVYCAEEDKGEYRDAMLKWLDSFKIK